MWTTLNIRRTKQCVRPNILSNAEANQPVKPGMTYEIASLQVYKLHSSVLPRIRLSVTCRSNSHVTRNSSALLQWQTSGKSRNLVAKTSSFVGIIVVWRCVYMLQRVFSRYAMPGRHFHEWLGSIHAALWNARRIMTHELGWVLGRGRKSPDPPYQL